MFCVAVFNSHERMHGTQNTPSSKLFRPLLTSVTFVPQARPVVGLQPIGNGRVVAIHRGFLSEHGYFIYRPVGKSPAQNQPTSRLLAPQFTASKRTRATRLHADYHAFFNFYLRYRRVLTAFRGAAASPARWPVRVCRLRESFGNGMFATFC